MIISNDNITIYTIKVIFGGSSCKCHHHHHHYHLIWSSFWHSFVRVGGQQQVKMWNNCRTSRIPHFSTFLYCLWNNCTHDVPHSSFFHIFLRFVLFVRGNQRMLSNNEWFSTDATATPLCACHFILKLNIEQAIEPNIKEILNIIILITFAVVILVIILKIILSIILIMIIMITIFILMIILIFILLIIIILMVIMILMMIQMMMILSSRLCTIVGTTQLHFSSSATSKLGMSLTLRLSWWWLSWWWGWWWWWWWGFFMMLMVIKRIRNVFDIVVLITSTIKTIPNKVDRCLARYSPRA